jgi:hypothetical protein
VVDYRVTWLPEDQVPRFEARAVELRQRTNCWGEFKWSKIGPSMLDPYLGLLDLAFDKQQFDLRYASMVIDSDLIGPEEIAKYHSAGGRDEAFLKFMRLLLSHRLKHLVPLDHTRFTLLYDKLSVRRELQGTLRDVLRSDMSNISAAQRKRCTYEHLSQADSKTLNLMQVTDLMTGATWSAWEGDDSGSAEKRAARGALRERIEQWAGGRLTRESFRGSRFYSLWRWKP